MLFLQIPFRKHRSMGATSKDESNCNTIGLLGMANDIVSFVSDERRRSMLHSPSWMTWISEPLNLLKDEGDARATTVLLGLGVAPSSESKTAVLGMAEELLGILLRKAPEKKRTAWLRVALELSVMFGFGNADMTRRLLDNSDDLANLVKKPHTIQIISASSPLRARSLLYEAVLASEDDDPTLVTLLLERGRKADLEELACDPDLGEAYETPLHRAAQLGCSRVALALIEAGAVIDSSIDNKLNPCTPLAEAIGYDQDHTARLLISRGADPHATYGFSGPAFLHASPSIADALLEAGFDPNAKYDRGRSALHYALMVSSCEDLQNKVEILHAAGADVNARDAYGQTPLEFAANQFRVYGTRNGAVEGFVKVLLRLGADDTIADNRGCSAEDMTQAHLDPKRPADLLGTDKWKLAERQRPEMVRTLAILAKHRTWKRRMWLLVLRRHHLEKARALVSDDPAQWTVHCPADGVFRTIVGFI